MRAIAIEENLWLFYDGTHAKVGHAIWPAPSISTATVLRTGDEVEAALPKNNFINEMVMVFREDSFDPVTRVRRGRLYKASDLRPEDWKVQAHHAVPEEARYPASRLAKRL